MQLQVPFYYIVNITYFDACTAVWEWYRESAHQVTVKVKIEAWTFVIALFTWVRLKDSSALQSPKWQLISMVDTAAHYPLPTLTDNWTRGACSRHTTTPISHTRPLPRSPRQVSYYSFLITLRVGGWVGMSRQEVSNLVKLASIACSAWSGRELNPHPVDHESNTLPLHHRSHSQYDTTIGPYCDDTTQIFNVRSETDE